jgi:hypothetical protein
MHALCVVKLVLLETAGDSLFDQLAPLGLSLLHVSQLVALEQVPFSWAHIGQGGDRGPTLVHCLEEVHIFQIVEDRNRGQELGEERCQRDSPPVREGTTEVREVWKGII